MINTDCVEIFENRNQVYFQVRDQVRDQVRNQVRYNGRWHQVEGRVRDRLFK